MLFIATDGATGYELFISDGTTVGTSLLKDINPGAFNGFTSQDNIVYNGKMYFSGGDPLTGQELWVTDGTLAGTMLLKDLNSGALPSSPFQFFEFNGKVYFDAATPSEGNELWVTDGTTAGTQMVKDILSGSNSSYPLYFIAYKDHLFFTAEQTAGDRQMFVSDGTSAGTHIVAPSIAPNPNPIGFSSGLVFDSSLFYPANYNSNGNELWKLTDTTTPPPNIGVQKIGIDFADVYPNPSNGKFTVKLSDGINEAEMTMFDVAGKKVYQHEIHLQTTSFNLNNLPKGIYEMKIQAAGQVASRKIQIE